MKTITRMEAVLTAALLIIGTTGIVRADDGGKNGQNAEVRLRTGLTGAMIQGKAPKGSADFRSDTRSRSRLNVEVEDVNLPDATVLTVAIIHGGVATNVGTIKIKLGFGELELDSQNGAAVPAVQSGDMVTVSNGAVAILAGVF